MSAKYNHDFVENYDGLVGFGFDQETDQATLKVYLQKISDDQCLKLLLPRMSQAEITLLFELLGNLLRNHLDHQEYHQYFLKD